MDATTVDGNCDHMAETITDFIKAFKLSKEFGRESAFRVSIQTMTDDGGAMCVVYLKENDLPVKGGMLTTKKQLNELRDLGVLDE